MAGQEANHERRDATAEDIKTLRHVANSLPLVVWVALLASAAERFTFYAVTAPWQNYIQNDQASVAIPGALGLGQSTATNITSAFFAVIFLVSTFFAVISDTWLGRYKTLCLSFLLSFCGCAVLFATSLQSVTGQSTKVAGLAVAMVLLGLGTGGVKATVSPFIGDQYPEEAPKLIVTRRGEEVVVDRALTMQYIYNISYWFTNIASLSLIASTALEKEVGFWAAYLLPLCSVWICAAILLIWQKKMVVVPPQANVLPRAAKVLAYAARDGFKLDSARPEFQREKYDRNVDWDNTFVSEISRGLRACKVMACFIPFHLAMNQMNNNLVSQAGQMRLSSIPNDAIQVLNSIACILLGPVVQKGVYPLTRKLGFKFGPIARMTWAFITMSMAMALAAGVQKLIYTRGPCYEHPLQCAASVDGSIPNSISVWAQTPIYFILALAEIFGFTTLAEYSYSEAPRNMRSLVQALGQLSSGAGSALGVAFSPVSKDPDILYLYTGLSVTMIISGPLLWIVFNGYENLYENDVSGATSQAQEGSKNTGVVQVNSIPEETRQA